MSPIKRSTTPFRRSQPVKRARRAMKAKTKRQQGAPNLNKEKTSRRRQPSSLLSQRFVAKARTALGKLRQGSLLAVSMTSLILLTFRLDAQEIGTAPESQSTLPESDIGTKTINEASGFISSLSDWSTEYLPKFLLAILILLSGWVLHRFVTKFLRSTLKSWHRAEAMSALVGMGILLFSVGTALSAIAGDVRALLGSVGLVGLALSWALQAPIESFTGWLLNSFRVYYTVGDRIEVGDVFGDVYKIDILTTTVWQAGGPGQSVQAAQPTGALITFPNSEVLRSNIVNYTRGFPYVWDEINVAVSNDSDLRYSMQIIRQVALQIFGESMKEPAQRYESLLRERDLPIEINELPSLYLQTTDSWTQIVVRYLVNARERRKWSTQLILSLSEELGKPEHQGKIINGYPRSQVEWMNGLFDQKAKPRDIDAFS